MLYCQESGAVCSPCFIPVRWRDAICLSRPWEPRDTGRLLNRKYWQQVFNCSETTLSCSSLQIDGKNRTPSYNFDNACWEGCKCYLIAQLHCVLMVPVSIVWSVEGDDRPVWNQNLKKPIKEGSRVHFITAEGYITLSLGESGERAE